MCTAISFSSRHHYFGRTLDLEYHYNEQVTITPRSFPFAFRHCKALPQHYAMIGMAIVEDNVPLYYEATNECGVSIAGLNFPGYAHYFPPQAGKDNIAPFELIPWLLGQCKDMNEVRRLLDRLNLTNEPFSPQYPVTPLHWMISYQDKSLVVESTKGGLQVHNNPVHVMTNSPSFPMQLWNLSRYTVLSPAQPENTAFPNAALPQTSNGMGALGLPGDWSSPSRFVRAAYIRAHAACGESDRESVAHFFHMLDAAAMPRGCVLIGGKPEITVYASCCNADTGVYHYTTYENRAVTSVSLFDADLDGSALFCRPLSQP